MAKLMSDQLLKLLEKTLVDLRNATSSLESVAGVMRSNLQAGNQIDLFGQDHHLANPSQLQEARKVKMTNDTFGLTSSISSESANLQQYLASRLPQQLERSGSTIYKMTWKQKVTPRQWQYCQLVASAHHTKEKDFSSWPTPSTQDNPQVRGQGAAANHPKRGTTLGGAVRLLIAKMEKSDASQLNPRFSLWLMGFPIEWAYCGERVTPSSRRSQQKS